jgi:lipoate-protein ligase A
LTIALGLAPPGSLRPELDRAVSGRGVLDPGALQWRVLVDPPAAGPHNMAVDHALAACLDPGEAVLRIYRWSRPTVSFGRNEPARGRYDPVAGREAGIEFVRRPTGGRAVLHDRELTYAVLLPRPPRGGLRATYRMINSGLVEALRFLGIPATMAEGPRSTRGLDAGPCFNAPARGEITVAGRKLVGSAQARLQGAILQHGSLLMGPGQDRLLDLISKPAVCRTGVNPREIERRVGAKGPISIEEVLCPAPPWSHLVDAVISGLRGVAGGDWHRGELAEAERDGSIELAGRYASAEWTWRR